VDGSGWVGVYRVPRKNRFNVGIVQNPTISLADDVLATKRVVASMNGPVVRMIPPPAQRLMAKRTGSTVVEVAGSHSVYVSKPSAVAGLIAKAAKGA